MRAARWTALAGLALLLTAGCGGGDDTPDPSAVAGAISSAVSAAASQAPATGGSATGNADRCAQAKDEIQTAASVLFRDVVGSIEVDGCRLATVSTTLGTTADDIAQAVALCQYAANEASSHDVAATSVVQAGGPELAAGTTAADCAGRPAG